MVPLEIGQVLRENGYPPEVCGELLERYVGLLLEWNSRINLISRRDTENVWEGHILHSLSPLLMIDFPASFRMLDLGTGGGLPGIPMAVVHGGIELTLLDSIAKKMKAVESIVSSLPLVKGVVVTGRAEEVGRGGAYRGKYDMVIARGVAPLVDLIRWARPFLRRGDLRPARVKGGDTEFRFPYLLALKGGELGGEIREAEVKAGGSGVSITAIDILFRGSSRFDLEGKKLVIVEFT